MPAIFLYLLSFRHINSDAQIPSACEQFIDQFGIEIYERKLYTYLNLHLCNLYDFGLLTTVDVDDLTERMQLILVDCQEARMAIYMSYEHQLIDNFNAPGAAKEAEQVEEEEEEEDEVTDEVVDVEQVDEDEEVEEIDVEEVADEEVEEEEEDQEVDASDEDDGCAGMSDSTSTSGNTASSVELSGTDSADSGR